MLNLMRGRACLSILLVDCHVSKRYLPPSDCHQPFLHFPIAYDCQLLLLALHPMTCYYYIKFVMQLCLKKATFHLPSSMATKKLSLHLLILAFVCVHHAKCIDFNYPAVFNFGDSNSDTGDLAASGLEAIADTPPYGQTYFQKPNGRYCDGRLIIDFLSKYSY